MIKVTIAAVALVALTASSVLTTGERIFSFTTDDDFYPSYQLSPFLPSMNKPSTNYQLNHQRSHMFRAIQPNPSENLGFNLQAQPSIISPSASIPFVVFGSGPSSNGKKVSKKISQSNNNEKGVYSSHVPKSQDTVDWSAEDMMQHPIDEAPRKSNRALGLPCSYSSDCGSGCCLLDRNTKIRSCQPLARMGEKCTKSQVKGDLYVDACPCMRGADLCSAKSRCSW